ncbi:MAG: phosphatidylserine decarboxylase family protein [Prolixibacteraceae bacterium]|nr:phosphatidylserine decarboxylase family protein [Prolixibacteraceae bacterium]
MRIHKEGRTIVFGVVIFCLAIILIIAWLTAFDKLSSKLAGTFIVLVTCFVTYFFRNPYRPIQPDQSIIYAPADGRIVDIDTVFEKEFLMQDCLKVSIFMSIWNVHVNRYPVTGNIIYTKYHPGNYFIASHPKSSELNEHQSVVIETSGGISILVKQIAGTLARRIICYAKVGVQALQGDDLGFIRFGSRVDIFMPINTEIQVKMNETVKGNQTIIARLK